MSALRRARLNKHLSKPALSELAGVDEDTITALEEGRTLRPRTATLVKLATALEVEPADIDPVDERQAV
jgi:transcriptional regulator with XRE-family HTH domain